MSQVFIGATNETRFSPILGQNCEIPGNPACLYFVDYAAPPADFRYDLAVSADSASFQAADVSLGV